jgi:hypothetical protein
LDFELAQLAKRSDVGIRKLRHWFEEAPGGTGDLPASIEDGNKLVDGVKPELIVETANLPAAADAVRDLFVRAGDVFEWAGPSTRRSKA